MPCFKLIMRVERDLVSFIDAESKEDIVNFMESNPDWKPGDVEGLIDHVGEELEVEYEVVSEARFAANFELAGGVVREKDS